MNQNLDALTTFVEVVERGSFTAAAKRLGISKSIASRRILQLELALKTTLLNRTTRGLAPTEAGKAFALRCRDLLKQLEEACDAASGRSDEVSGLIRLTAPASFEQALVVPVLAGLMAKHPGLSFQVALDERRLPLLDEGFDLAIRAGPLADSTLMARKLTDMGGLVVASPSYLARRGTPQVPADLAAHVCLEHSEMLARVLWRFENDSTDHTLRFERRLQINSLNALCGLAIAGAGIAAVPPFLAQPAIERGALKVLLPTYQLQRHAVSAVFPPAKRMATKLRVVLDAMVDYAKRPVAQWGSAA